MGSNLAFLDVGGVEESVAITKSAEETQTQRTRYGAGLRALLEPESAPGKRRQVSGLLIVTAALGAVSGLLLANLTATALAWCITFLLLGGWAISWLYGQSPLPSLQRFRIGNLKPLSLSETLAIALIGFIGLMCGLFFACARSDHSVKLVHRQIVDIIFVSNADAEDHHDPLPGTKPVPTQKKISTSAAARIRGRALAMRATPQPAQKSQRQPLAAPLAAAASKNTTPPRTTITAAQTQPLRQTAPISPSGPPPIMLSQAASFTANNTQRLPGSRWITNNIATPRLIRHMQGRDSAALEEVAPAEMVEVTDSQGESQAAQTWQQGGHSAGGNGAAAEIADYLKALHTRIKRAWTPPRGETRTAEILFRLKRTGQLASIKLTRTSGSSDSDEAAMAAIASCAPFKPLPPDFKASFLDLQFTFNYSVDRLAQAPGQSAE